MHSPPSCMHSALGNVLILLVHSFVLLFPSCFPPRRAGSRRRAACPGRCCWCRRVGAWTRRAPWRGARATPRWPRCAASPTPPRGAAWSCWWTMCWRGCTEGGGGGDWSLGLVGQAGPRPSGGQPGHPPTCRQAGWALGLAMRCAALPSARAERRAAGLYGAGGLPGGPRSFLGAGGLAGARLPGSLHIFLPGSWAHTACSPCQPAAWLGGQGAGLQQDYR